MPPLPSWLSGRTFGSPFALDVRAVGIFRILLASTILADQLLRLSEFDAFLLGAGLVLVTDSREWNGACYWSLYWLGEGPLVPLVLEAVRLVATVTLALGIRSRLSAFVLFLVLASLATRNPLVLYGGDRLLIVMTFFGAFLPLGGAWSFDRRWHWGEREATVASAATTAYVVQVLLVWFMAGLHKSGPQWWSDGTAGSMELHLEVFASVSETRGSGA